MSDNILNAQRYTDRDLIESIVGSFYILDYGYVSAVNSDKTINVTHAKRLTTRFGDTLPATITKNIQVLTLSGAGFSIQWDIKKGDKVLLLGLKNYIDDVDDVSTPEITSSTLHYSRETIKALPLCLFNDSALVNVSIEKGQMTIKAEGGVEINAAETKLTGGTLTVNGTAAPTGSGPFCGIAYCPFTGAPQCGSTVSGT